MMLRLLAFIVPAGVIWLGVWLLSSCNTWGVLPLCFGSGWFGAVYADWRIAQALKWTTHK